MTAPRWLPVPGTVDLVLGKPNVLEVRPTDAGSAGAAPATDAGQPPVQARIEPDACASGPGPDFGARGR